MELILCDLFGKGEQILFAEKLREAGTGLCMHVTYSNHEWPMQLFSSNVELFETKNIQWRVNCIIPEFRVANTFTSIEFWCEIHRFYSIDHSSKSAINSFQRQSFTLPPNHIQLIKWKNAITKSRKKWSGTGEWRKTAHSNSMGLLQFLCIKKKKQEETIGHHNEMVFLIPKNQISLATQTDRHHNVIVREMNTILENVFMSTFFLLLFLI